MQVLVAPAAFGPTLRASIVAAAIGRGLEAAGFEPPDLCPVADGGPGTLEVLLGRLGGETAATAITGRRPVGFGLLDGGATALVELAAARGSGGGTRGAGELIVGAARTGADVVLVAPGGPVGSDAGAGALAAIAAAGGLGDARLIVLCDARTAYDGAGGGDFAGVAGGLAGALAAQLGAELRSGAHFVLDALDFDARMRAARALVVGAGRLDRASLEGAVLGEAATRARQAGMPAHAIVAADELDRFDARILDLQEIRRGGDPGAIEDAARALAPWL